MSISAAERYLQAWHGRHPDGTRVFATLRDQHGLTSYARLAARVDAAQAVLDVACGAGTLLARIAARAPRSMLAGVDLSATDICLARTTLPVGQFTVARAQALPLASASMDAVTCHLALMLMDDPERVLSETRRVLRPGGELHLAVVNPVGFDPEIGRIIHTLAAAGDDRVKARPPQMGDRRTFTADGLHDLLAIGFVSVDIEEVVVARDIPRAELWEFLNGSVYGLDHLTADEAREQLERLALPSLLPWKVPLYIATARAVGEH